MDTGLVLPETLAEAHALSRELWAMVQELRAAQEQLLVEQAALRERVGETGNETAVPALWHGAAPVCRPRGIGAVTPAR